MIVFTIFIKENELDNVAIMSRPQCVDETFDMIYWTNIALCENNASAKTNVFNWHSWMFLSKIKKWFGSMNIRHGSDCLNLMRAIANPLYITIVNVNNICLV